MKQLLTLIILLGFGPFSAKAFEAWPELQFFDPRERDSIEDPNDFNGEYYSDIRTFAKRLDREQSWWTEENMYVGSVGSLNAFRFQVEERLRARNQLSEKTRMGLLYVHQRDLYYQTRNFLVELSHKLTNKVQVSVLSNFLSDKQDLDLGGRLEYFWNDEHRTQISYILPQHSYNKRNQESGKKDVTPVAIYLAHFIEKENSNTHVFTRVEPGLNWRLRGDEDERYMFSKWIVGLRHLNRSKTGALNAFQVDLEDKFERTATLSDPTDFRYWRMQRLKFEFARNPRPGLPNGHPYRYGLRTIGTFWETNGRQSVEQFSALPFFEWSFPMGPASRADQARIEIEQAYHWDRDQDKVTFQDVHDQTIDSRLNLTYDFIWPQANGRLSFKVTADVDRFGTGDTWEGGGGQAQFTF